MFPGIPMTCACRLMFSGITCLLVWTATFARADESRSPASAFRVIQTRYEAHLERLREEKQPVEIALNARDQALKELVEQQRDESRLEHADWVSLALAYELLRDNQACCRCCEKALELAPDNPAPCVPLLRALLSDGKADLARERAAAFTQRFPKDRDLVASVHLMLYAHLNAVQKFALAYEQLAQVIEIEFESVATSRRLHAQIVGHLRLLRDVAAQGACEPQFVAFAQELDGQLGDACKRTESDFVLGLSLRRLRTELAAIGIPARTADAQADALDFHSREVFRDPTADSLRELMKAMSQIPARAHLWGDVEELKTALRANQQRADALTNAPDCEAAVKQLRVAGGVLLGLVEQSARRSRMVGHTLASLQDVRWLPQDLDEQHTGRDTLVVVWNPFAPGCKDVFRFAQQMELRVRQNAGGRTTLDTIFLAPYCNLTWNEEKRAATRGINVSHEDEARAYAFLLKSLKVSQRCGLAPPSDPFFGQVGSDYFPAFFLVDSDRKVQLTVTGAEPEKLRYLADQIIACLKRDGESPSSK